MATASTARPTPEGHQQERVHPEQVDHEVPLVTDDGVDQQRGDGVLGTLGRQLGGDPTTHGVPGDHRLADAELLDHPAHQLGVVAQVAAAERQPLGGAVPGHVDRDHLEATAHQPVQGLGVEEPFGGEAVHHHERHAATADRQSDPVAVVEREGVAGEPGSSEGSGRRAVRGGPDDGLGHGRHIHPVGGDHGWMEGLVVGLVTPGTTRLRGR